MLSDRATHLVDRAAVARLRMALSTTLGRSDRAVEICLAYLRDAGIAWSPHPADEEVQQEYEHMVQQLGSRPIEALIDLPPMRDPDWRTTMDVLQEVMAPAWYTDKNLLGLVLLRMTNLSLEYGHSDASCHAYVCLNLVLGPRFGDYRAAFRFGQLSFDLVEQRGLDRFKARVYHVFGSGVMPWTRPLHASRALLRRGFDVALETGDLVFAAYICTCMITNLFASGDPLGDVQREAENGLAFAQKARFGLVVTMIAGQLSLIRVLRSLPPDFVSCNEAGPDEGQFEPPLEGNPQRTLPACLYWIYKLQAHFFAADYTAAIEAAAKAQRLLWITEVLLEIADYHFYGALARAASYDAAPADERLHHLAAIVAHQKQLALWAENCPENFRDRASLVAAEIARIDGRDLEAMRLYEEAMQLARTHGFLQNEGLANERAAQFYAARGFETSAHAYLRHARDCYRRWGAEGKVRQLDQTHPHLREGPVPQRPTTTIEAPVEHLDLATVVNISQAVSGEIVLEQLLNTLMTLAVEHAGAERGLLLLPHADALWIEAEATTGRDAVTVRLRHAVVSGVELPVSVLHYVLRTQEPVLLDDAAAPGPFAADAYLRQTSARSVLCLPLVKQARLIGVLYLENRLTSHVFTAARSAVLTLLASQAAIALENARLYADVQHENRARTAAEEALRASEERYRTIVEAQTDLICRYRPDTTLTFVNEAYCRYFDRTREELLGTSFLLLLPEDTRQASLAHIRSLCDHPRVARYEHAVIGANGDIRWQQWVDSMILDAHGHLLEVQAVARDITESKRAEQRLMAQYTVTQILAAEHQIVPGSRKQGLHIRICGEATPERGAPPSEEPPGSGSLG